MDSAKDRPFYVIKNVRNFKRSDPKNCQLIKLENYKYDNLSIKYYLKVLRNINNSKKLLYYPGSPSIMSYVSDNFDKLSFYELHNNEFQLLRKNFIKQTNCKIFHKDGFDFLNQKINQFKD